MIIGLMVALLIVPGCGNMNQTTKGGLMGGGAGAAVGAGIGALIGKGKGAAIGAAIGSAVGAGAGVLIGRKMDKKAEQLEKELENAKVETVTDVNGLEAIKITFESGLLFKTGKIQGNDRNIFISCLHKSLSQKVDIVGGSAAAAGLGYHKGAFVYVVLAALQRMNKLTYNQQRRVAGVVMDIFQSHLSDLRAFCIQQHAFVAVVHKYVFYDIEMYLSHHGDEYSILFLFHFLCKDKSACLVINQFSHLLLLLPCCASYFLSPQEGFSA